MKHYIAKSASEPIKSIFSSYSRANVKSNQRARLQNFQSKSRLYRNQKALHNRSVLLSQVDLEGTYFQVSLSILARKMRNLSLCLPGQPMTPIITKTSIHVINSNREKQAYLHFFVLFWLFCERHTYTLFCLGQK